MQALIASNPPVRSERHTISAGCNCRMQRPQTAPSARPAHELPQHVPRPPAGVCRCIVCITEGEGAHARACAKERARVIETAKKKGEREKKRKKKERKREHE